MNGRRRRMEKKKEMGDSEQCISREMGGKKEHCCIK